MDAILALAITFRAIAMGLFFLAAVILARAWRRSSLQEILAFSVLSERRRRRMVTGLLAVFTCLAIAVGLSVYQDLYTVLFERAQLVGGIILLTAAVATFELSWQGFGTLPPRTEALVVTDAPEHFLAAFGAVDRAAQRPPPPRAVS